MVPGLELARGVLGEGGKGEPMTQWGGWGSKAASRGFESSWKGGLGRGLAVPPWRAVDPLQLTLWEGRETGRDPGGPRIWGSAQDQLPCPLLPGLQKGSRSRPSLPGCSTRYKEKKGREGHSPSRFTAEPERDLSVLASRPKASPAG